MREQARDSKLLATMRRDLDIDCDPAALVLAPPDRSQLREMFRRFEFRNLLRRVDELEEALPSAELTVTVELRRPWVEGELRASRAGCASPSDGRRAACARESPVASRRFDGLEVSAGGSELLLSRVRVAPPGAVARRHRSGRATRRSRRT